MHRYAHATLDGMLQQRETVERIHVTARHACACRARARTSQHAVCGTYTYTHTHDARSRVYAVHQRGVLAPCRMWVSSLSHTPLFLRNQCMHTTAADERAQENRGATIRAHTETESAANALTYDGLLLREAVRRSELGARHVRTYVYVREYKSAAVGRKATQARLSRASFFFSVSYY